MFHCFCMLQLYSHRYLNKKMCNSVMQHRNLIIIVIIIDLYSAKIVKYSKALYNVSFIKRSRKRREGEFKKITISL